MTEEGLGVDLLEGDLVLPPSEDVDLIHEVILALCEVPFSGDGDLGVVVPLGELAVLRVREHSEGNPEIVNFRLGQ